MHTARQRGARPRGSQPLDELGTIVARIGSQMQHDVIIGAMGVNPKSMVSKGPEYGLPEPGRRSAAGTACIRGRFPTMSEPAPIPYFATTGGAIAPAVVEEFLGRPPTCLPHTSVCSAISSASSTSMPRYRTVDSILLPAGNIASNRRPVIPSEVGDRLEVWHQPPREPDQLNVALRLPFQPTAGLDPVQYRDVDLSSVAGWYAGRPVSAGSALANPSSSQVEFFDESVNHSDRVVLRDPFIEAFRETERFAIAPHPR